jgi:hypothetical protein
MATTGYVVQSQQPNFVVVKWPAILTAASIGDWFACPHYSEKTITIDGTFDGSTVTIEGCIDTTQSAFPLTDPQGNAISASSQKIESVLENTYFIRPKVTGGTAPSIDVWLLAHTVSKK